jgi:fumarylacetoacetase
MNLDATYDASLRSWVASANDPATDFPIQNLPLGVFRPKGSREPYVEETGVAIGDQILSLASCARGGLLDFDEDLAEYFAKGGDLSALLAYGRELSGKLRVAVSGILRADNAGAARRASELLVAQDDAEMVLPMPRIWNYTDFYASIHHATNVGSMFRPDNPLLPNYKHVPIGYHGRASSIVVSGTPVKRPKGQTKDDANAAPVFAPTKRLDYEMEVGAFVTGNRLGEPIPISKAADHLFGLCLVNDWSARDIQSWEYQPLGPFLSKSFATTISPWIVTAEALAPFRVPAAPRPAGDPKPLPYLIDAFDASRGAFDITVEVWLRSETMREQGTPAFRVSRGSFRDMYWTLGQMIAHHTSNGCNLAAGDLIASGTISGPGEESRGCLLERTMRGTKPLELPTGERRAFLEDGDEVIMRAHCEREGYRRIGFGECTGTISPASLGMTAIS